MRVITTPSSRAKLEEWAVALAIPTVANGLYIGYRYLRDGHVNPFGLAALVLGAAMTAFVAVWAFLAKRRDES